jgi:hypothetical protein
LGCSRMLRILAGSAFLLASFGTPPRHRATV